MPSENQQTPLTCSNCRAAWRDTADRCRICEQPHANCKTIAAYPPGMFWCLAWDLLPGDRFRWDGETWFIKSIQAAVQPNGRPSEIIDGKAQADPKRTCMITVNQSTFLVSNAKNPKAEQLPHKKREPTDGEKLNLLQKQNQALAENLTNMAKILNSNHDRYNDVFVAIKEELCLVRNGITAFADEYSVSSVIASELLSVQTVQMHQIMCALKVEGSDAMQRGHALARKVMEAAGVDAEQIEARQKIRQEILNQVSYDPEEWEDKTDQNPEQ